MMTYRLWVRAARDARIARRLIDRDFWLAEAMIARWAMNGNPTWFTRDSIRDWNASHQG